MNKLLEDFNDKQKKENYFWYIKDGQTYFNPMSYLLWTKEKIKEYVNRFDLLCEIKQTCPEQQRIKEAVFNIQYEILKELED